MEKEISLNHLYAFPSNIETIKYKGKILVISVETASWIVLENEEQLSFFNLLKNNTIRESLDLFNGVMSDAEWVITQIEARQLESMFVDPFNEKSCMIYLTNACNMHCPHCFLSAGIAKDKELSTDEIKNLLDNLNQVGVNEVTFSGGEICTRYDLLEIIRYAHSLSFKVNLLTNGSLWTDDQIDDVSGMISMIQISIDGFSESENSTIRGVGNFSKALETLDRFISNNVAAQLAITPYPSEDLQYKIKNYSDFAIELRNKYRDKELKILFTTGIMDGRELTLSALEKERYKRIMQTITTEYLGEDASDYPFILTHLSRKIMDNCSYGCFNISSDGNVYMCSKANLKPIANIRTSKFDDIYILSEIAKKSSNINNLMPCKECCLKYICGGGCRVDEFIAFKQGLAKLEEVPIRVCTDEYKETFYDLMIRTNQDIFQ